MSAPVKAATLPEVPTEVLSFAAEMGVSEWVYPVLEMTMHAYPARAIKIFVQHDYEDPDWRSIVLQTERGNYTSEQYLAAHRALATEIVRSVPAHARQLFVNICL
jgi:hypothetical protein